jgi:thiamine-phosphate pyrophosphorylase
MATHAPARVTRTRRAELLRGIYVILNDAPEIIERARAVLDAGIRIIQYRAKSGIRPTSLRGLRELTWKRDALLILNDRWRAAVAYDCDGVHLGPGDDGFATVARMRPEMHDRLIGLSCGSLREIEEANETDVDYLGIGPVFATASKSDAGMPLRPSGLRRLAERTHLPVAAIGGIDADNLLEIRRSGVAMAAVISAVASASDPGEAARRLAAGWDAAGRQL